MTSIQITDKYFVTNIGANFARAFEIAMFSKYSIYFKFISDGAAKENQHLLDHDERELLIADTNFVRNHMNSLPYPEGFTVKFVNKHGDRTMIISISRPDFRNLYSHSKGESIQDIYRRVVLSRNKKIDPSTLQIQNKDGYDTLLRNFYQRVNSVVGVNNAIDLAQYIAILDNAKEIRLEHLAEAIQYQYF